MEDIAVKPQIDGIGTNNPNVTSENVIEEDDEEIVAPVIDDLSRDYKPTYVRRDDYREATKMSNEFEAAKASLSETGNVNQKESRAMYRKLMEEKRQKKAAMGMALSGVVMLLGLVLAFLLYRLNYFIAYPILMAVISVCFIFKGGFTRRIAMIGYTLSEIFLLFGGIVYDIIQNQALVISSDLITVIIANVLSIAIIFMISGSEAIHEYHRTKRAEIER